MRFSTYAYGAAPRVHPHPPGHRHPEDRPQEVLYQWIGYHGHLALPTNCQDLKSRIKEINLLAPKRCPVPFYGSPT